MFQVHVQDVANEERKEDDEQEIDASFLTGNPRVRVNTGKLRFFRVTEHSPPRVTPSTSIVPELPTERSTLVCIISVPTHMSPVDLLNFIAGYRAHIELVRILRDSERDNCMALLQFTEQEHADQFFMNHDGQFFNSIEQDRCNIVFVRSIEFDPLPSDTNVIAASDEEKIDVKEEASITSTKSVDRLLPPPPSGLTEIPTCAVCLDRLDATASGILTTLCNHTFHCDCLFRWEGSSCPVCRYSHGDDESACEVCGTVEHLWICLICGHIGCGRYSGEHAKQHYHETYHTYSLELETQRVWDYAGDGYVHRLILNKQDGKFVEFPSPNNHSGERSQLPPPTTAELEEEEHQKLEKLAVEYNHLLTSQLEEQRIYYEQKLQEAAAAGSRRAVSALEHEKKQLKKANEALVAKSTKLEKELTFVRELNMQLLENKKQWEEQIQLLKDNQAKSERESTHRIADLESQVRDLMFYLDTQSKVEQSAHKQDIQGGTIEIETKPSASSKTSKHKGKGKK